MPETNPNSNRNPKSTDPIRYTPARNKNLRNSVKNFNAKLDRLLKKFPDLADIYPQQQYVSKIKSRIKTVSDYNYELRKLNTFLKKGMEEIIVNYRGIGITKWEHHENKITVLRINKWRAAKELKMEENKVTLNDIERANFNPMKYNFENATFKGLEHLRAALEKQSSGFYEDYLIEKYKRDYIENLFEHLSTAVNFDRLLNLIHKLPATTMYYAFYVDPALNIRFISDPLDVDIIADTIYEKWVWYLGETNTKLLKEINVNE